ncbi:MAG TPA: triple tyrosine motif-containing protein [Bacteroidia bacterium]|nr:triple tyrosine motif-containing protein [Bacteroidia bacterium]
MKFLFGFLAFALSLSHSLSLRAQYEFRYKVYDQGSGIPGASGCITDTFGYTWFFLPDQRGNVIMRYDGKNFKNFFSPVGGRLAHELITFDNSTEPSPFIRDHSGRVWLMGDSGITVFQNGMNKTILTEKGGLPNSTIVEAIPVGESSLCICTLKGLAVVDYADGKYSVTKIAGDGVFDLTAEWKDRMAGNVYGDFRFRFCSIDRDNFWMVHHQTDSLMSTITKMNFTNGKLSFVKKIQAMNSCTYVACVDGMLLLRTNSDEIFLYDENGVKGVLPDYLRVFAGKCANGKYLFLYSQSDSLEGAIAYDLSTIAMLVNNRSAKYETWKFSLRDMYHVNAMWGKIWLFGPYTHELYFCDGDSFGKASELFKGPDLDGSYAWPCDDGTIWIMKSQQKSAVHLVLEEQTHLIRIPDKEDISGVFPVCKGEHPGTFILTTQPSGSGWLRISHVYNLSGDRLSSIGDVWFDITTYYRKGPVFREYVKNENTWNIVEVKHDSTLSRKNFYFSFPANDDKGGTWLIDSTSLYYYKDDSIRKLPGTIPENTQAVFWFAPDRVVCVSGNRVMQYDNGTWKNFFVSTPFEKYDLQFAQGDYGVGTFEVNDHFIYTLRDGKIHYPDSVAFPGIQNSTYSNIDDNGRIFVWGQKNSNYFRKFWMIDDDKTTEFILADSLETINFQVAQFNTPGIPPPVFESTTMFIYNDAAKCYLRTYDFGKYLAYFWEAYVNGNDIYASGYGKDVVQLKNFRSISNSIPLSFQEISSGNSEESLFHSFTCAFGELISIKYISIDPFDQSAVYYQSRLIGLDSSWSALTKNESSVFQNLSPGHYRFEVRSRGYSLLWGKPISVEFDVLPPWYRTTWAYILFGVLFFALMWVVVKLNGRRLNAANKKLQQKITEATSEIQQQKNIVEEKQKEIIDSIHYAERIQRSLLPSDKYIQKKIEQLKGNEEDKQE